MRRRWGKSPGLADAPLAPQMTAEEVLLFSAFLRATRRYLEFGCGGSTGLAAGLVGESVVSVDSSREWIATVQAECAARAYRVQPRMMHADIGPTGDWGFPTDRGQEASWPAYHGAVWAHVRGEEIDFFFVDGRFRVACAAQIALRCGAHAVFAIHDYASRPQYHVVEGFARRIAGVDELAVFVPLADKAGWARAQAALARHEGVPG